MKNKICLLASAVLVALSLSACGDTPAPTPSAPTSVIIDDLTKDDAPLTAPTETPADTEIAEPTPEPEVIPENSYQSELTHEWISEDIKNQRPIAVMVDNEYKALSHFGTSMADIVYEVVNSTKNSRITRLMCIFKDYNNEALTQIGSIRSVRTTNAQVAPEYDAILVHDGGPFYVDIFFQQPFIQHLSGGFTRIDNGKPREYTEYITPGEIDSRISKAKINPEYTKYYQGEHFKFAEKSDPVDLSEVDDSIEAKNIEFPFPHNKTMLEYMPETQTYRYSEYNEEYIDELTGDHMEFKNVIIQECILVQYDENGYMDCRVHQGDKMKGWYVTNGYAEPITWKKGTQEYDITHYYNADGEEITINTGKTYIAIVPEDSWTKLVIK